MCLDIIHEYAASGGISHFDAATIDYVWENTPYRSTLRTLFIDMVGWQMHVDTSVSILEAKPEFLHGVLSICSDRLSLRPDIENSPLTNPRCGTYHIHRDSDGPCQEVEEVKPSKAIVKADAPSSAGFGSGPFVPSRSGIGSG